MATIKTLTATAASNAGFINASELQAWVSEGTTRTAYRQRQGRVHAKFVRAGNVWELPIGRAAAGVMVLRSHTVITNAKTLKRAYQDPK